MDFISDEQMKQLEGGSTPDVISDEEMAQMETRSKGAIDTPSWVPEWYKNAASMVSAKQAGLINGATLGYGDLGKLPVVGQGFEQAKQESPISYGYGNIRGALAPGVVMGAATAAVAPARMMNSVPGRIAINTAQGGIEGAIRNPNEGETRFGNAVTGARDAALLGTGMEALAGGVKAGGKLAQWFGGKLGGVTKPEAEAFKRAPQQADEYARMLREDPKALSESVKSRIGGGLEETFDRVSEPALQKVGKAVSTKTVQVRPDQFKGTAADDEIQRAWNLRNPPRHAPYTEVTPYEVRATPVETKMNFGSPESQTAFLPNRPYDAPEVPVQTVSKSIVKDGPEQVLNKGFTRGEVGYEPTSPRPMGDVITIRGPQALRAKRAASKATAHKNALSPLGYDPASEVDAAAAGRLKLGLEGAAPDVIEANKKIEEAARYSGMAKARFSNNPAAILTDSDSLGSVPTRQMRQFLDQNGNTGLDDMANSLAAGKALGPQPRAESFWEAISRTGARGLLRGSAKADSAEQMLRDMKIRALIGSGMAAEKKDKK